MIRLSITSALFALVAVISVTVTSAGCAVIGDEHPLPREIHSGIGFLRLLEESESEFAKTDGETMDPNIVIGGLSVWQGDLFYDSAPLVTMDGTANAPWDLPWQDFGPRKIFRSSARNDKAFEPGTVVFEASESWQGQSVFHPNLMRDSEGRTRMYYAADGGIGVAFLNDDGSFDHQLTPVLATGGDIPTHPAVVVHPTSGQYIMYYDNGSTVWIATSVDGLDFQRVGPLPVELESDHFDEPRETRFGQPAARVAKTALGRDHVRVYFSVAHVDAHSSLHVAGSIDGINDFSRTEDPIAKRDRTREGVGITARVELSPGAPALVPLDGSFGAAPSTTEDPGVLVYFTMKSGSFGRKLVAGVNPGHIRFDEQ